MRTHPLRLTAGPTAQFHHEHLGADFETLHRLPRSGTSADGLTFSGVARASNWKESDVADVIRNVVGPSHSCR